MPKGKTKRGIRTRCPAGTTTIPWTVWTIGYPSQACTPNASLQTTRGWRSKSIYEYYTEANLELESPAQRHDRACLAPAAIGCVRPRGH
jgi:hypothetical protein